MWTDAALPWKAWKLPVTPDTDTDSRSAPWPALRRPWSVVVVMFGGPGSNWTTGTETETEAKA